MIAFVALARRRCSRSACSGSRRSACASATRWSSRPGPRPALSLVRFGLDAVALGGGSLIAFAALETWMHSRAGMHMHWWQCLEGPVHRNAVPILLALSLAAGPLLAALATCSRGPAARRRARRLLQPRAARAAAHAHLPLRTAAPRLAARARPARTRAARSLLP